MDKVTYQSGSIDFYQLKVKNISNNPLPSYATEGSSGFDLRAFIPNKIVVNPRERAIIPTGLFFDIPDGFEIQIRSRSGLAANRGISVLNSPGTIDSDYYGQLSIILMNHSVNPFTIENGDRIAQGVFAPVFGKNLVNIVDVDSLEIKGERNEGKFGSTGIK